MSSCGRYLPLVVGNFNLGNSISHAQESSLPIFLCCLVCLDAPVEEVEAPVIAIPIDNDYPIMNALRYYRDLKEDESRKR